MDPRSRSPPLEPNPAWKISLTLKAETKSYAPSGDQIETFLSQSSNFIEWDIIRCGSPPTRSGIAVEECRWRDRSSSLSTWYVAGEAGGFYRLRQDDEICVDLLSNNRIEVRALERLSRQSVDHFIADQAIPRALANQDKLVLHAGAVRVDSKAILFLGQSGRGKSTLVASFDGGGADLLGDDAMVITSRGSQHEAQAVYPSLRLFGDSIKALKPVAQTHALGSHSSKRRVDVPFASTPTIAPLRITALFTLGAPGEAGTIGIRSLSISEMCMAAIENSFLLDPSDVSRGRQQLALASDLARQVPAFELSYPRDYARLPDVRRSILAHISRLD